MGAIFRAARLLCTLLGLLVLTVSFTPFMPWAAGKMPVDWYQGEADVLIVLGGSMLVDGTGPHATLGADSYLRCTYAAWNIQKYQYRYVILSGPDGLAETMAKYLLANGAARPQILIENAAHSTFENAAFVKNILDHQPGLTPQTKLAVLTSDYHSRRAKQVFQHLGLPVRMIPAPDLGKRSQSIALRWNAFLDMCDELAKTGFYKLAGRI